MKFLHEPLNVIIPAGASGIGRSIAGAFLEEGCRVFICDISGDFIEAFQQTHPAVTIEQTDVSDYNQVTAFFKRVSAEVDHIDVIVNCAGIAGPTAPLQDINPKDWERTIDISLNGMFYILKEGIHLLKKSKTPSIINIASSASFFGFPLRSPYTAAKWAVIGLTKTLAMELGGSGVRVNAICPGSVSGERIDRVLAADAKVHGKTVSEMKKLYTKQVSMKTFVEPEDVAHLALFLASEYGRFISGQAIGLDGHTEGLSTEL